MKLKLFFPGLALLLFFSYTTPSSSEESEWSELRNKLKTAVTQGTVEEVKNAVIPIINTGGKKAVETVIGIIERTPAIDNQKYWLLVNSIATLTDPEGLEALAKVIISIKGALSRDLMFGLQTNLSVEVVPLLGTVLCKSPRDIQKMAIEHLVNIGKEECVEALIEGLKSVRDSMLKEEIVEALKMLTGSDCGDSYRDWKDYWEKSKGNGLPADEEKTEEPGFNGKGFRTGLSRYRKKKSYGIETLGPIAALVITTRCDGRADSAVCFDNLEETLTQMRVKNTVIRRKTFEEKNYSIPDETLAIFINCTQIHPHCVCQSCSMGSGKSNRLFP